MSVVDNVTNSFSSAFDSIIGIKIYYKDNDFKLIQAGLIVLLPTMTAFLLKYNEVLGVAPVVKVQNYPLLLFLFMVATLYVLVEPKIAERTSAEVSKLVLLSIHIFAFALAINLIYALVMQLLDYQDLLQIGISSVFSDVTLDESTFAALYGLPFLLLAIGLVFSNSVRAYRAEDKSLAAFLSSGLFWRTSILVLLLAVFQYMAFILVGQSAAS